MKTDMSDTKVAIFDEFVEDLAVEAGISPSSTRYDEPRSWALDRTPAGLVSYYGLDEYELAEFNRLFKSA
jgi:hypothetical protein